MSEQYGSERQYDRLPGMIAGAAAGASIGADNGATTQPALDRAREQVIMLTKQLAGLSQELAAYLHTRLGPVNELTQAQGRQSDGERERKPSGLVNDLLASIDRARLEATRMQALIVRLQQL